MKSRDKNRKKQQKKTNNLPLRQFVLIRFHNNNQTDFNIFKFIYYYWVVLLHRQKVKKEEKNEN